MIQYVYDKYGRDRAAQVANVITYRPRSALREMAKVGGPLTRAGRRADASGSTGTGTTPTAFAELRPREGVPPVPELALDLAGQVLDYPRHLGIHSGGMVMADRPLVEFCPVEWARMEDRSVLQWDKDDCAAAGLVKFDLLGLGMLTMLHLAVDLVREHEGIEVDLATIPQEDEVYDLLCAADTIGVFQVESRAQMATLPRLRPRCFYDLVIEVALIRPGPIQGGSVHPYLRRRNGEEPVTYPHPILEPCLEKTLGVPLFQEQLMQIAIDAAGFTPGEADQLRQAMGSKRSKARMAAMRERLIDGMAERGIVGETAEEIATKLEAFARLRLPREPLGELRLPRVLQLVAEAATTRPSSRARCSTRSPWASTRRTRSCATPCATAWRCSARASTRRDATARWSRAPRPQAPIGRPEPGWHADPSTHAVRIGLRYVRGLAGRAARPHRRPSDEAATARSPTSRTSPAAPGAPVDALECLATAGAFGVSRRRPARRAVGRRRAARRAAPPHGGVEEATLPGIVIGYRGARAAGHGPDRGDRRRPVGDRPVGGAAPHRVRARAAHRARGGHGAEPARAPAPHDRGGRRCRHPPPAARDGEGRHRSSTSRTRPAW